MWCGGKRWSKRKGGREEERLKEERTKWKEDRKEERHVVKREKETHTHKQRRREKRGRKT